MAFEVELLVTFPCHEHEGVAALAREHLPTIQALRDVASPSWGYDEAVKFLTSFAARGGQTEGPKNGLTAWSYGGNHTPPDIFVEVLRPFWEDLFRRQVPGGPHYFHHVVVLYQLESSEHVDAIEVFLQLPPWDYRPATPEKRATWPLVIKKHEGLPFRWR